MNPNSLTHPDMLMLCVFRKRLPSWSRNAQHGRLGLIELESREVPATFVVTTTADAGEGSLREAVEAANHNHGDDVIVFSEGLGPIELNKGTLFIHDSTGKTTIAGPVSGTQVVTRSQKDGTPAFGLVSVADPSAVVSLANLTLENGSTGFGGAIHNDGHLSLDSCTITGNVSTNTGGGVSNNGILTVSNCLIADNRAAEQGGGIYSTGGHVTIANTVITRNHAKNSGGIGIRELLTIANSQISDNTAIESGGGIGSFQGIVSISKTQITGNRADASGGINNYGDLTVTDSVISGNVATMNAGGIGHYDGTFVLDRCLVVENVSQTLFGGGIFDQAIMSVIDSTFEKNSAGVAGGGIIVNLLGKVSVLNSSFTDNKAATGGGLANDGETKIENATFSGNYAVHDGGAIYGYSNRILTVMKSIIRNNAAENGGGIGSRGKLTISDTTISENRATHVGGGISNHSNGTVDITNSDVAGNTAGTAGGGLFSYGGIITLKKVNLSKNAAKDAAGIGNDGTLTMSDSTITVNTALEQGGGIINYSSGTILIGSSTVSGNTAGIAGGLSNNGKMFVSNSTIHQNTADTLAGGLLNIIGSVNLMGVTFSENRAHDSAGAILNQDVLIMWNSTLSMNEAINEGGGLANHGGTATITNSTISGNRATSGGGIHAKDIYAASALTIVNSTITRNTADASGGGIHNVDGEVSLANTIVAANLTGTTPDDVTGPVLGTSANNVIGVDTSLVGITNGDLGNRIGTAAAALDARLAPLADNGGETRTHALLAGSPALNAGKTNGVNDFDQRGLARPFGGLIDVGAFESNSLPHLFGYREFAVGTDSGLGDVTLYNPSGSARYTLTPFEGFTGGIRTATADFNGDDIADLVVGTGPGRPTSVRIFDGVNGAELFGIDAFESGFVGGLYVAVGDLTGDGHPDLAITPDEGGGPRVRVFDGKGFTQVADFYGIDDPAFRGGARAALSDLNGDGRADLLVAAGFGGGPRLAVYNGATLVSTGGPKFVGDFFVFEQSLRNGVFLSAGDLNGDGYSDVLVGGGPGGGPRVYGLSGRDLTTAGTQTQVANFFAGDENDRGGVRLAMKDLDNDGLSDILVGSGSKSGSRVVGYRGVGMPTEGPPGGTRFEFDAFPSFSNGVYVG